MTIGMTTDTATVAHANSAGATHPASRRGAGRRVARVAVQCGLLLTLGFALSACDKCGRSTPINKPWGSAACDSGPSTR